MRLHSKLEGFNLNFTLGSHLLCHSVMGSPLKNMKKHIPKCPKVQSVIVQADHGEHLKEYGINPEKIGKKPSQAFFGAQAQAGGKQRYCDPEWYFLPTRVLHGNLNVRVVIPP